MTGDQMAIEIGRIRPELQKSAIDLSEKFSAAIRSCQGIGIPSFALNPLISQWNDHAATLNEHFRRLDDLTPPVQRACRAPMSLREAGQAWADEAAHSARPLHASLTQETMEGHQPGRWTSSSALSYWRYIDRNQDTADNLAALEETLSTALISLADAIDKQNVDKLWQGVGMFLSHMALIVGGAIIWGTATGASAGAPVGGVGAAPGAAIGAIIGAIVGTIMAVWTVIQSYRASIEAGTILSREAADQLARLTVPIRDAHAEPWPAPPSVSEGKSWR